MDSYTLISLFFRFFSRALMLLLVLPLVNCAKGIVARRLGDDTADREGRITLNPMAHLDMFGSLCIMLCGFGWSKPLPINYSRMKNPRLGMTLIALTSPVTLFASAIVCKIALNLITRFNVLGVNNGGITAGLCIYLVLIFLSNINVCLGTIHLLPFPQFDGFTLLQHIAGAKFNRWYYTHYRQVNQISFYIVLALFFMGTLTRGVLDPLGWLIALVDYLLDLSLFWMAFI